MKLFRNILYAAEPAVDQRPAIARAASLAENNQAELALIDVLPRVTAATRTPSGLPDPAEIEAVMLRERRDALETLVAPYREHREIRTEVRVGQEFLEVIRSVLRDGHDLVIKPAENPDFLERVFGSDDMHLLRKCPCPVWLTGPREKSNYANILAAVDFDLGISASNGQQGLNHHIIELAASLALSDFAALHVVHAWDAPAEGMIRAWSDDSRAAVRAYVENERKCHEQALEDLRLHLKQLLGAETYGDLAPRFHLRRGAAATLIPELAKELEADLVVMGTVGRTGVAGLIIGNTAEAILEQLQCSVLAVKPPGFVSPITLPG